MSSPASRAQAAAGFGQSECRPARSARQNPASATGDVSPAAVIVGGNTGLHVPFGVAVDPVANRLYVANSNHQITVYPRNANGDVVPCAVIAGSSTGLSFPQGPYWPSHASARVVPDRSHAPRLTVTLDVSDIRENVIWTLSREGSRCVTIGGHIPGERSNVATRGSGLPHELQPCNGRLDRRRSNM
jgi:hypothetical protein